MEIDITLGELQRLKDKAAKYDEFCRKVLFIYTNLDLAQKQLVLAENALKDLENNKQKEI